MENDVSPEYKAYLKSPKWQQIRERIFLRDGCKCQICGSTKNLQCHHINGKYRFCEEKHPESLITLCAKCHEKIHLYWRMCDSIKLFYEEQAHQEAMKRGRYW
jgi:hypothetical protein